MPSSFSTSRNCGSERAVLMGDIAGDLDVVARRQRRQKIVFLENEPDRGFAQLGALGVGHAEQVAPGDVNGPGGRRSQPADDVKQGRFAGSGRTHNRDEFARLHVQIHASQRMHVHFARMIGFLETADGDDRLDVSHTPEPRSQVLPRRLLRASGIQRAEQSAPTSATWQSRRDAATSVERWPGSARCAPDRWMTKRVT